MRKIIGVILLALLLPGLGAASDKKTKEPFYRRFLVSGNWLDDKILEQEKKVESNPKSADLRNDFGNLLAARHFFKEAREQYEVAMNLDRSHYLAAYNLGMLYETEGEVSRAISAYEKSVDHNRGFPPSRFRLGRLYEKRGRDRQAIDQYAKALRIDPSMRDVRRNPLVADSRLLDQVSLENYAGDLATASMAVDSVYVEQERFRRVPVDRALSSEEVFPLAAPGEAVTPMPVPAPQSVPIKIQPQPPPPPPPPGRGMGRSPEGRTPGPRPGLVLPPPTPTPKT